MSNVQLDPAGDPPDAVLPHTPKELFRDPSEWRHFLSAYGPEGRAVHDLHLGGVLADPGWKPYGPHVRIGEEAPFRECFSDLPEGPILRAVREALSGAIELREYRLASLSRKEGNGSVSSVPILARGDRVVAIFHGETAYLAEHAHHLLQHLIAERNLLASKPDAHAPAIDAVVHFYHQRAIVVAGFLGITRPEINFRICSDLGDRDPALSNVEGRVGPLPQDWCAYRSGEESRFRRRAYAWRYNNYQHCSEGAGYSSQAESDSRERERLTAAIAEEGPQHAFSVQLESDNFEHRYEGVEYRAMVVVCHTADIEEVWLAIQKYEFS